MKRVITCLALLVFLTTPFLSACDTSNLKQENEGLKKQIESLSREKAQLESQVREFTSKGSELTAKVDELTRVNEELKAKIEKKAPAKMKVLPKNK